MPEVHETRRCDVFHEVFTDHERLNTVQENLSVSIRAAGLKLEDAIWCLNYHPNSGVFVCVATVVPTDGTVLIAWTPDPVWLADKLMDSDGDTDKIARAIDEASKRPEKPGPRPKHKPHTHHFGD